MWRNATLLLCFLTISVVGLAQNKISASVDRTEVGVAQQVIYTLDVSGTNSRDVTAPAFNDFRVVSGPRQSSQTTIEHGQITNKSTISYTLRPTRVGKLTIEPAILNENGRAYKTRSITIDVTQNAQNSDADLLGLIAVNKSEVYQGEHLVATYSIYNRYNSIELNDYTMPPQTGFAVEDIEINMVDWDPNLKVYKGLKYKVAVLKREVLFPQVYGDLRLEPFTFEGYVGRWAYDYDKEFELSSNAPRIKVKPLPLPQPTDFTGGVGQLELDVNIPSSEMKVNEAVEIMVTIKGNGNLKLIDVPELALPDGFEVYDPKIVRELDVTSSGVSGERSFEFVVIPREEGEYRIAPYQLSYFDPEKEEYVSLSPDSVDISVAPSDDPTGSDPIMTEQPEEEDELDSDIRHIKTSANLHQQEAPFFATNTWFMIAGAPLGLLILVMGAKRIFRKENTNVRKKVSLASSAPVANPKQATKTASRYFGEARKHQSANNDKGVYEAVFKALYGYLGERMQIPVAELNKGRIRQVLTQKSIADSRIAELESILASCEMARFAPVADIPADQVLSEAENVVEQLESELK